MTRSFDVFFDLHLNKQLSKQSWCWWFETPPRSLWHHCNVFRPNSAKMGCFSHLGTSMVYALAGSGRKPANSVSPSSGTVLNKGKAFLTLSYLEFAYVFYWSYWNQCSRMCAYHFTLPFFIMTPWYGNAFRIICPLCVNPSVTGGFPRPRRWTFDVFFVVRLNKLFDKEEVELPVISDALASHKTLMWGHYKQKLM